MGAAFSRNRLATRILIIANAIDQQIPPPGVRLSLPRYPPASSLLCAGDAAATNSTEKRGDTVALSGQVTVTEEASPL